MLYPEIEGLLEEFKRRDFTTFLVTNGMTPSKLEALETEPTQLYVSLDAPNEDYYKDLCKPQIDNGWKLLNQSLDLLSSFDCRTVLRTTCVKGYNMFKFCKFFLPVKSIIIHFKFSISCKKFFSCKYKGVYLSYC